MAEQAKLLKLQNLQNLAFYRRQNQWKLQKQLEPSTCKITSPENIEDQDQHITPNQEIDLLKTDITAGTSQDGKTNEIFTCDKTNDILTCDTTSTLKSVSERLRLLLHFHQNTETTSNNSGTNDHRECPTSDEINGDVAKLGDSVNFFTVMEECSEDASDITHWTTINGFIVSQCSSWEEIICSPDSSCESCFIRNAHNVAHSTPLQSHCSDTSDDVDRHCMEPTRASSLLLTITGSGYSVGVFIKNPKDQASYSSESIYIEDLTLGPKEQEIFLAGSGYFVVPSIQEGDTMKRALPCRVKEWQ